MIILAFDCEQTEIAGQIELNKIAAAGGALLANQIDVGFVVLMSLLMPCKVIYHRYFGSIVNNGKLSETLLLATGRLVASITCLVTDALYLSNSLKYPASSSGSIQLSLIFIAKHLFICIFLYCKSQFVIDRKHLIDWNR